MTRSTNIKLSEEEIQDLWDEVLSIEDIDDRRKLIFADAKKRRPRYKILAEKSPFDLFLELGGIEWDIVPTHNWAFEYTYDDWVNYYGGEEDETDADEDENENEDELESDQNELDEGSKNDLRTEITLRELEWDLEKESIDHAEATGHWLQTGFCPLKGPDDVFLPFIFGFTEGEFDGSVLETPYSTKDGNVSFGFLFG